MLNNKFLILITVLVLALGSSSVYAYTCDYSIYTVNDLQYTNNLDNINICLQNDIITTFPSWKNFINNGDNVIFYGQGFTIQDLFNGVNARGLSLDNNGLNFSLHDIKFIRMHDSNIKNVNIINNVYWESFKSGDTTAHTFYIQNSGFINNSEFKNGRVYVINGNNFNSQNTDFDGLYINSGTNITINNSIINLDNTISAFDDIIIINGLLNNVTIKGNDGICLTGSSFLKINNSFFDCTTAIINANIYNTVINGTVNLNINNLNISNSIFNDIVRIYNYNNTIKNNIFNHTKLITIKNSVFKNNTFVNSFINKRDTGASYNLTFINNNFKTPFLQDINYAGVLPKSKNISLISNTFNTNSTYCVYIYDFGIGNISDNNFNCTTAFFWNSIKSPSFTGEIRNNIFYGAMFKSTSTAIGFNPSKVFNNLFYDKVYPTFSQLANLNVIPFNTSYINNTNIINKYGFGGNAYLNKNGTGFSQICQDSNNDNICDLSNDILNNGYWIDKLPLKYINNPPIITYTNDFNNQEYDIKGLNQLDLNTNISFNDVETSNLSIEIKLNSNIIYSSYLINNSIIELNIPIISQGNYLLFINVSDNKDSTVKLMNFNVIDSGGKFDNISQLMSITGLGFASFIDSYIFPLTILIIVLALAYGVKILFKEVFNGLNKEI